MNHITDGAVIIQASSESVPALPAWFGEAAALIEHLRKQGVLIKISEQLRFARRRFGRDELIDFLTVLLGYATSGERTLEAFYEAIRPCAQSFMALLGRDRMPSR